MVPEQGISKPRQSRLHQPTCFQPSSSTVWSSACCSSTCTPGHFCGHTCTTSPTISGMCRSLCTWSCEMLHAYHRSPASVQKHGAISHQHQLPDGSVLELLEMRPSSTNVVRAAQPPLLFIHGASHGAWCFAVSLSVMLCWLLGDTSQHDGHEGCCAHHCNVRFSHQALLARSSTLHAFMFA